MALGLKAACGTSASAVVMRAESWDMCKGNWEMQSVCVHKMACWTALQHDEQWSIIVIPRDVLCFTWRAGHPELCSLYFPGPKRGPVLTPRVTRVCLCPCEPSLTVTMTEDHKGGRRVSLRHGGPCERGFYMLRGRPSPPFCSTSVATK